jgi:hypothetical protein
MREGEGSHSERNVILEKFGSPAITRDGATVAGMY